MVAGVGSRVVQLVGTVVLARLLAPEQFGEVAVAAVCVATAGQLTSLSVGQYLIAKRSPAGEAFQASVLHVVLGVVAMAGVIVLAAPLGGFLNAPGMAAFVPGYALAHLFDRIGYVPGRLLVRDLRFRVVALTNGTGELLYTGTALALAFWGGWGGAAIVAGVVARAALKASVYILVAPRAEWLVPVRLRLGTARAIAVYGAPLMASAFADLAATRWDNLVVAWLFGPAVMGRYALAYSLAETPVAYVAEHIGDVLMPSYSKLERGRRAGAAVRAAALMALVIAPLGVGLGAIAPTLLGAFFDARWAGMEWMVAILSVMTVFRPMTWSAGALLQAEQRTGLIMLISFAKTPILLGLVAGLGWLGGPLWACVGSGATYAIVGAATIALTGRYAGIRAAQYHLGVIRPLLACVPMFAAVEGVRLLGEAAGVLSPLLLLGEVVTGAVVYVAAAFAIAGPTARDLVAITRQAVAGRSVGPSSPPAPGGG